MLFSISMRKMELPLESIFCNLWDLRENRGQKRPLGQKVRIWSNEKKNHYINFSKLEYVLLWPMVNFRLKVAQIWDLSSEIQGFEALARARPSISNPWIQDDKSQIWATFRQKLTIGHKNTYSSFEKLIY